MMNRNVTFVISVVLILLCSIGMFAVDSLIQNETTPYGIVSFEFIANIERTNAALLAWGDIGRTATGISLGLDYLYILLYVLIFSIALRVTSETVSPVSPTGGKVLWGLAYLFPLFGLSDAIENFSLIQLLLASQNPLWPQLAYYCALFKFTGVGIALVAIVAGQVYAHSKTASGQKR